jgi:hypothetical protein
MVTITVEIGEDHTHIDLLTGAKAHAQFILPAHIFSSNPFFNNVVYQRVAHITE